MTLTEFFEFLGRWGFLVFNDSFDAPDLKKKL
eukprot:CAMPEP_0170508368 /NCGR_PEP_ID=MMETSP0208-20121228/62125_1 /TAXON_ID=197538 /ORGANISM="Strombidium inclinatum, Strain S3" /LENGTH=31 /DNA_ID= /DNA_START= /DNA_END= /DNA_ORIENTATION=